MKLIQSYIPLILFYSLIIWVLLFKRERVLIELCYYLFSWTYLSSSCLIIKELVLFSSLNKLNKGLAGM